ncbi:MAG: ATP-binding cassette domain-containing protein [Methanomassiliicoccus sp.]|nr:ATP-binding cassette domain-containing protein [Methanomassiliicoccus sp.]
MDASSIIEIEDLYTNFYTKGGVVYVLDGINLRIKKGETFGLVGESGCGKSVTANSIMCLVPSPPSKVEGGRIMFALPPGYRSHFERMMGREASKGTNDPEAVAARQEFETALAAGEYPVPGLGDRYASYRSLEEKKGRNDPETVAALTKLIQSMNEINILELGQLDLQRIRGKVISMIFQEPTASLNPVFTAGDQIAEIILLHEKKDLTAAVLKNLDRKKKLIKNDEGAQKLPGHDGEITCSACGAKVQKEMDHCPSCDLSFPIRHVPIITSLKLRIEQDLYARMNDNPEDGLLWLLSKIPILKRYKRPMENEAFNRAIGMLRMVRVPDPVNVANSYPYELSGGMQQRVMIAMALACKPQLLIADEPTTALDVTIQAQILKLMRELQKDTGTTILMITHNLGIIAEICDRVGVMYAGSIVELTSNQEIFKEPLHPYTQGLLSAIPRIDQELPRLEIIEGSVPNLSKPPTGCRFHPRCPYAMAICSREKPAMMDIKPGHSVACHLYTEVKQWPTVRS